KAGARPLHGAAKQEPQSGFLDEKYERYLEKTRTAAILLEHGAQINAVDRNGNTPFHYFCQEFSPPIDYNHRADHETELRKSLMPYFELMHKYGADFHSFNNDRGAAHIYNLEPWSRACYTPISAENPTNVI